MADIVAAATGNWSVGATWVGGVKPGAGDNAIISDASVVTIDENVTCAALKVSSTGNFSVTATRTITANILVDAGNQAALVVNAAGEDLTITGNVTASTAGFYALNVTNIRNLTITGNVLGGAGAGAVGAKVSTATGDITITGSVTGGAGAGSHGLEINTAAVNITVDGAVTSDGGHGISIAPSLTGNLIIHGDVTAGGAQHAVNIMLGCVNLEVVGNVTGGGNYNYGIYAVAAITGTATVTGTVTGGTAAFSWAIYNETTTAIVVDGDVVSGTYSEFPIAGKFQLKSGHKITVYNDTPALVDYTAGGGAKRGRIIGG